MVGDPALNRPSAAQCPAAAMREIPLKNTLRLIARRTGKQKRCASSGDLWRHRDQFGEFPQVLDGRGQMELVLCTVRSA